MEEKWYYASFVALNESGEVNFDIDVEGSYFPSENDDTAIAYAKNGQRMVRIMMTLVMWIWSWFRFVRLTPTMIGKRFRRFGFN